MEETMAEELRLAGTLPETWANTILFRLAEVLDYPTGAVYGDPRDPRRIFEVDPDKVLDEACETIWRYMELDH
jgi:hypothetical protein